MKRDTLLLGMAFAVLAAFAGDASVLLNSIAVKEDDKIKVSSTPGVYEKGAIKTTKYPAAAYKLGLKVK